MHWSTCPREYDHVVQQDACESCGFDGYDFKVHARDMELEATIKWMNTLCYGPVQNT